MYWGNTWGEGGAGLCKFDTCGRREGRKVWGRKAAAWSAENLSQADEEASSSRGCVMRSPASFRVGPALISPASLFIGWEHLGLGRGWV